MPQEPTIHDLERGLLIDEHALEDALTSQPDLFYRVSKVLTLKISERDYAKKSLADTEAAADLKVRDDARIGGDKITEKEVEARRQISRPVQEAHKQFLELNAEVGRLSALKEAFLQRSYALKDLVSLYLHGYYESDAEQAGRNVANALKNKNAEAAKASMRTQRNQRERVR